MKMRKELINNMHRDGENVEYMDLCEVGCREYIGGTPNS